MPAFVSTDMFQLIQRYQPELWVYGHTHESCDYFVGKTRLISNPLGYIRKSEDLKGCYRSGRNTFDIYGRMVVLP
jgi:hypothetical protein